MKSVLSSAALAAAVVACPAHAQNLDQVVVTANRAEHPIGETLADVKVIERNEIDRSASAGLPELLRVYGALEISQNGGPGAVSGLFLRGTRTSQTLILVDGVRLENPSSGGGNLEYLPLSAIDRIEIVRGPASAMYGSGAIGGVIQIFTRTGDGAAKPFASVGIGSRSTWQAQAGVSGSTGPSGGAGRAGTTRYALSVGAEGTQGYEATRPVSPAYQNDRDGNLRRHVNASLVQGLGGGWEAGGSLMIAEGRVQYDDAFSTPESARMAYRTSAANGFVRGRVQADWSTELRVGRTGIDYTFSGFSYAPRMSSQTVTWQNTVALPVGRLQFGVDHLRQRIEGEGVTRGNFVVLRSVRNTDSIFGAYELTQGAHLLRVMLRQDRIETVGSEPTGGVSWGYRIDPKWLVRASYASAFRAPTFDDLYSPFGANPALRPEKSRGVDLALERRSGGSLFKATAFASRIRDAIELDASFVPQNVDSARVHGVSVEARERIGPVALRAQATWQDPRGERIDAATGATVTGPLSRRARHHAVFGADWHTGPVRMGATWVLQGARFDTDGNRIAGYGVLDLNAVVPLGQGWDLFGRLGNVTDRRYETAWGYNMPPRTLFVGVRYGMGG